jgi:hypothetical protein
MPIICNKIKHYNVNDPRYNFHIEDSTKYNKIIYPSHLMKHDNNKVSVYNNIEEVIKEEPNNFKAKKLQSNSFYDQSRIKKDLIEHYTLPSLLPTSLPGLNIDNIYVLFIICLIICLCFFCLRGNI